MSGPKVMRIVTVEEIRAICLGHLARLQAAVERWVKVGQRNDLVDEAEIEGIRKRYREIEALFAKGKYLDLQKQVPDEIAWIEADMARRFVAAQQRAADERRRDRRRAAFAQDLLQRTGSDDAPLSSQLRSDLEAIAQGGKVDAAKAEAALAEVLRSRTASPATEALSDEQKALAARLGQGLQSASFDAWLETRDVPTETTRLEDRVASAIEGLKLSGWAAEAAKFAAMLSAITDGISEATRRMRLDTILIEISRTTADAQSRQKTLAELDTALAEARTLAAFAGSDLGKRSTAVLASDDPKGASLLVTQLTEFVAYERNKLAAAARRAAMLAALSEAGYEVREGLSAATPVAGTMVLRRAASPDMGVEVSGAGSGERIQVRPVRFAPPGSAGDAAKDRDIETLWCSDFDRLRKSVAATDGELVLERALPVGATPVMVISDATIGVSRAVDIPAKPRTMNR